MSDTTSNVVWTSISDDVSLAQGDQIRINLSLDCGLLSYLTKSELTDAFGQQQAIGSVLDVQSMKPWYDPSPIASAVAVLVNPQQGVTAGDLRNGAYTALSSINSQKMIPCSGFTVGLIERAAPGTILQSLQPTPTQTISLVAMAVIAVVVVFLIVQIKEAI